VLDKWIKKIINVIKAVNDVLIFTAYPDNIDVMYLVKDGIRTSRHRIPLTKHRS